MGGGRLRRPPLINYQFYIKTIPKICIKTCQKYTKNTPQEKHQNTKTPTRAMPSYFIHPGGLSRLWEKAKLKKRKHLAAKSYKLQKANSFAGYLKSISGRYKSESDWSPKVTS